MQWRMTRHRLAIRSRCVDVAGGAFSIHLREDPRECVAEAVTVLRPGDTSMLCSVAGRPHRSGGPTTKSSSGTPCTRRESHGCHRSLVRRSHEVPISAGLVEIDAGECEIHVPVANGETFLRGELAHGYRSPFVSSPQPTPRDGGGDAGASAPNGGVGRHRPRSGSRLSPRGGRRAASNGALGPDDGFLR